MKSILLLVATLMSLAAHAGQNGGTLTKHPDVLWVDSVTLAMVSGASDLYALDLMSRAGITSFQNFSADRITNQRRISESEDFHRVWDPIVGRIFDGSQKALDEENQLKGRLRSRLSLLTQRRMDIAGANVSTWFVPLSTATINMIGEMPVRADNGDVYVLASLPIEVCVGRDADVTVRGREMAQISQYCLAPTLDNVCDGITSGQECAQQLWQANNTRPKQIAIRVTDPKVLGEFALTEGVQMVFGLFVEPTVEVRNSRSPYGGPTARTRIVKTRGAALVNPVTGKLLCTIKLQLPLKSQPVGKVDRTAHVVKNTAVCRGDM